jgi:predicted alpha/beta-fold hydrolase
MANPNVVLVETGHGGHCAFLGTPRNGDDGYWAEGMVLRFLAAEA